VVIFLFEVFMLDNKQAESMIYQYGLVPDNVRLAGIDSIHELRVNVFRPFFTNMFLHGGWGHLISNMWILFIFGDNVEDRMGKVKYFLFYKLCGLIATLAHYLLNRNSAVPVIGASGFIRGSWLI
jgi:membrane associated rhomboid family serine protease